MAFLLADLVFLFFGLIALRSRILSDTPINHILRDALARKVRMESLPVRALSLTVIVPGACTLIPVEHLVDAALFLFGAFAFRLQFVEFKGLGYFPLDFQLIDK